MLPLPTEATIEAMNVSTDRRHPFHTFNDRNLFKQFKFIQQNIIVDVDDVERDMEISKGKGSLRHFYLQSGSRGRPKICTWMNQNHETTLPLIH